MGDSPTALKDETAPEVPTTRLTPTEVQRTESTPEQTPMEVNSDGSSSYRVYSDGSSSYRVYSTESTPAEVPTTEPTRTKVPTKVPTWVDRVRDTTTLSVPRSTTKSTPAEVLTYESTPAEAPTKAQTQLEAKSLEAPVEIPGAQDTWRGALCRAPILDPSTPVFTSGLLWGCDWEINDLPLTTVRTSISRDMWENVSKAVSSRQLLTKTK